MPARYYARTDFASPLTSLNPSLTGTKPATNALNENKSAFHTFDNVGRCMTRSIMGWQTERREASSPRWRCDMCPPSLIKG